MAELPESMKKLVLNPIRELDKIFGASGLVKIDDIFYVIADDDLSLGIIEPNKEIIFIPLVSGTLPKNYKERKKVKPDWEALTLVSKTDLATEILAVPSGSKAHRQMGSFIALNDEGVISMQVDFSKVYSVLERTFPNLNIEGACLTNNFFQLFQRGNGADSKNAIINLDLEGVLSDIRSSQILAENRIINIKEYSLGHISGIPLSFTDACFVNEEETWFLAAAEGGASTYDDGAFAGAVIGIIDRHGEIKEKFLLDIKYKPEGLTVEIGKNSERIIHVVTDADSSEISALLCQGIVSLD